MISTSSGKFAQSGSVHPLDDPLVKKIIRERDLKIATLEMTLASNKSSLSEAHLRARQAEEVAGLMNSSWDMKQVAEMIGRHFDQRGHERAVQQQALIQATLVSLNTGLAGLAQGDDIETFRSTVNTVAKGLTQALGTMHEIQVKEKHKQGNTEPNRSANGTPSRN